MYSNGNRHVIDCDGSACWETRTDDLLWLVVGILSDKYNLRGPFVIGCVFTSIIGYIVLYTQSRPGVAYTGAVIAAVGVFPAIPVVLAWAGSATGGDMRKGRMARIGILHSSGKELL